MKRVTRWLARLYPSSWRARYGSEFHALLEDVGPSWRDSLDVLWGASRMQLATWGFGKIAVLFGLAGVLLAWAASFAIPVEYASRATVRILGKNADAAFMHDFVRRTLTREALTRAILDCGLYPSERSTKSLEDVIEIMKSNIKIVPVATPTASNLQVEFNDENRFLAQSAVMRLVALLIDENLRESVGNMALPSSPRIFDLLDPPSLPVRPINPARLNVMAMGLTAGILTAVLVAALRRMTRARRI